MKVGDITLREKDGKHYRIDEIDEQGNVIAASPVVGPGDTEAGQSNLEGMPQFNTIDTNTSRLLDIPTEDTRETSIFSGVPTDDYESRSMRWALPDEPDKSPLRSALAMTTGDLIDAIGQAPKQLGKEAYTFAKENPITTAAGLASGGLGPAATGTFLAGSQLADKLVSPYISSLISGGNIADVELDDPNTIAGDVATAGASGVVFPGRGGFGLRRSRGGLELAPENVAENVVPGERGSFGLLSERPDPTPGNAVLRNADGTPILDASGNERRGGIGSMWDGMPLDSIPDNYNVPSYNEQRRLGIQGLDEFNIPQVDQGQRGSPTGEYADMLYASHSGLRPDEHVRRDLQETTLNAQLHARAGRGANDAPDRGRVATEQAEAERMRMREVTQQTDEQFNQRLAQAESNLAEERAAFEATVQRASEPDVPADVAGARLREQVDNYHSAILDQQSEIRGQALLENPNPNPEGVAQAAANTRQVFTRALEENHQLEPRQLPTEGQIDLNLGDPPRPMQSSQTVTQTDAATADWLVNRSQLEIEHFTPAKLEALRKQVGARIGEMRSKNLVEPSGDKVASIRLLGRVYGSLKDAQMSMYDETGRRRIREADNIFQENLDVIQTLEPFLAKTGNQDIGKGLFSRSKLPERQAAQRVVPNEFQDVAAAELANMVQAGQRAILRGDTDDTAKRAAKMGAEGQRVFDDSTAALAEQFNRHKRAVDEADGIMRQVGVDRKQVEATEKLWMQQWQQRYGNIPGLSEKNLNPAEVVEVFRSGNLQKMDALHEMVTRAGDPQAFEDLRRAYLLDVFNNTRSYHAFEKALSNKTKTGGMAKYFDPDGDDANSKAVRDMTNKFRMAAMARDRILVGNRYASRGSNSEMNSIFHLATAWFIGPLLRRKVPNAIGDEFYNMIHDAPTRFQQTLVRGTALQSEREVRPLVSGEPVPPLSSGEPVPPLSSGEPASPLQRAIDGGQ